MKRIVLLLLLIAAPLLAKPFKVDHDHSSIGFSVKHMGLSSVRGEFHAFSGKLEWAGASLKNMTAKIKVKSIDTGHKKRDQHLLSEDFLNQKKYPTIFFNSQSLLKTKTGYIVTGILHMNGVSNQVNFPIEVTGPIRDDRGKERIGISGELELNRQDYGIKFNKLLDHGGVVVGNKVTVFIEVAGIR